MANIDSCQMTFTLELPRLISRLKPRPIRVGEESRFDREALSFSGTLGGEFLFHRQ